MVGLSKQLKLVFPVGRVHKIMNKRFAFVKPESAIYMTAFMQRFIRELVIDSNKIAHCDAQRQAIEPRDLQRYFNTNPNIKLSFQVLQGGVSRN